MLFCLTADYTPQALNAMRENPNTNRQAAVEELLSAAGGKLVAMYGRATNGPGVMVIFDVADPAMAPAITGVAVSAGIGGPLSIGMADASPLTVTNCPDTQPEPFVPSTLYQSPA